MDQDDAQRAVEEVLRRLGDVAYNGQPLGPANDFEVVPLPAFLARPRPPYEELLGPLIVKGQRCVVGAATGEGKSTLIWWIVKALASAGRFLDWRAPRPCRVLVVDAEQTDHDIARLAMETHLGDEANVHIIHVPDGLSLNTAAEERQRLELALEQGGYDVVILDPLYKLHTGDPSDEREAVALMRLFDGWRLRFGFALILPSHMRKPDRKARERDFSMHEIFGASAYLRGAETVVGLRLISDGISRLYFFKSRSPGLPVRTSWPLRYDRAQGFSIYETPTDRANREIDALKATIRNVLIAAGGAGVTIQAIMEEVQKPKSTVHRLLKELGAEPSGQPGTRRVVWTLPDVDPDQQAIELAWSDEDDDDD
jgi:hypothetical protein